MSILQASRAVEVSPQNFTTRAPWWRSLVLALLLAVSLFLYIWLIQVTPHVAAVTDTSVQGTFAFMQVYLPCFLPYLAAALLLLLTRPATGRWRWVELGLILGGALLLRIIFLPLPPNLSRDSWRYVWDARVFLHGYSPYVYAPGNNVLISLRNAIFTYSRYRNVPSIYPPVAQYIYALSYLLVPNSLTSLKMVFMLFDLASCVILAMLLTRRGLDPSRVLLYAWCPLPIIEFALEGHVDVLAITFTLLAMLTADDQSRRGRVLTGFFIGMGTLAKLYPILLVVPLVRLRTWKRDLWLVFSCLLTIVIGYLPFYIQGHGQVFGFLSSYTDQQGYDAGVVQLFISWLGHQEHMRLPTIITWEHLVALMLMAGACLVLLLLREREVVSREAGTLFLFGLVMAVSSHVFSWYTAALLPWLILLWPARGRWHFSSLMSARLLALVAVWLFICLSATAYLVVDWNVYYLAVYDPLVAELALAALIYLGVRFPAFWQKGNLRGN